MYDVYYERILRFCIARAGSIALGQDLCSETWLKALKNIGRFKWKNISFSAWLYRIAHNTLKDYWRRQGKYRFVELEKCNLPPAHESTDDALKEEEEKLQQLQQREVFWQKFRELSAIEQTVLSMFALEGESYEVISQSVHKSVGAVKVIKHRAMKKL